MTKTKFRKVATDLENIYVERFQTLDNKGLVADYRAEKKKQYEFQKLGLFKLENLVPFHIYKKEFSRRGIDYLEVLHNLNFVPSETITTVTYAEYAKNYLHVELTEDQAVFLWSLTTDDLDIPYQDCKTGNRSAYIVDYIESLCDDKGVEFPEYRYSDNKERNRFFDNILDPESNIYNMAIHLEVLNKIVTKCFDAFIKFYNEDRNEV